MESLFLGPRGRYHRAVAELKGTVADSADVWVKKLKNILRQREYYKDSKEFDEFNSLYNSLLALYKNDRLDSPKHLLEAYLITGASYNNIASSLVNVLNVDANFIGLYHELFYNIRQFVDDEVAMFRYVIQPMTSYNSDSIALPHIWKLLAYRGGEKLLVEAGLGRKPLTADDMDYLLHLGSMRNISNILKYVSRGLESFGDNAMLAQGFIGSLLQYESARSINRDMAGLKLMEVSNESEYSDILTGLFRMAPIISDTDEDEDLSKRGLFNPDDAGSRIECDPVIYNNEEGNTDE